MTLKWKTPSIYSQLYIKYSRRARKSPRVERPSRPRLIAWAGPTAFMRDRFYELDNWYKARIQRPELYPPLLSVDPSTIFASFKERIAGPDRRAVNIGFKERKFNVTRNANRDSLEKLSKKMELRIDLGKVISDQSLVPMDHFNIFQDLFMTGVYFYNTQKIDVKFGASSSEDDGQYVENSSVCFGNIVDTCNAVAPPRVVIEATPSSDVEKPAAYNTLLMLNLEGLGFCSEDEAQELSENQPSEQPLNQNQSQMLHWFVANMPDSATPEEGQIIVPYMQPIPFHATGYHRIAFILFRHSSKIDFSNYQLEKNDLLGRKFEMNAFFKLFEESITPSAVRFCQMKWDESCDVALHELGLKSPRYWYEWNQLLKPLQKEWPMKPVPFNHYLNMYRDPAEVRRSVQRKRLEMLVNQGSGDKLEKPKYPDVFYRENRKK
uniref:Mitochondrial ribosomal protein L38 n=1 Tax=Ditylenchus dipsaci TaxID=166011 RepID=A0A915ED56_9BILA